MASVNLTSAQRERWLVHVWLLVTFVGSLAVIYFHLTIALHTLIAVGFVGLVVVHLRQRRQAISVLLSRVRRWSRASTRRRTRAAGDAILTFLLLNVLVSGVIELTKGGMAVRISIGFGQPVKWHTLSALLLLVALGVHLIRRASRFRTSTIR